MLTRLDIDRGNSRFIARRGYLDLRRARSEIFENGITLGVGLHSTLVGAGEGHCGTAQWGICPAYQHTDRQLRGSSGRFGIQRHIENGRHCRTYGESLLVGQIARFLKDDRSVTIQRIATQRIFAQGIRERLKRSALHTYCDPSQWLLGIGIGHHALEYRL